MTFKSGDPCRTILPDARPCVGCGAAIRHRETAPPGSRAMFHPAPVCEHLRSLLRSRGIAEPAAGDGFLMLDNADEARN